jgi:hypothetical protein
LRKAGRVISYPAGMATTWELLMKIAGVLEHRSTPSQDDVARDMVTDTSIGTVLYVAGGIPLDDRDDVYAALPALSDGELRGSGAADPSSCRASAVGGRMTASGCGRGSTKDMLVERRTPVRRPHPPLDRSRYCTVKGLLVASRVKPLLVNSRSS